MIAVDIGNEDQPGLWQYELAFNGRQRDGFVTFKKEAVLHNGQRVLEHPDREDDSDTA